MIKDDSLLTFSGWYQKALEILKNHPFGTALVDESTESFFFLEEENILVIELEFGDELKNPTKEYFIENSVSIDPRAWFESSWDSSSIEETQKTLLNPVLVKLNLK